MSVSLRYRLTKVRSRPSSCTRWRLRPPMGGEQPVEHLADGGPGRLDRVVAAGEAAERCRDGNGHGHRHTSLRTSSDSGMHRRRSSSSTQLARSAAAPAVNPHDHVTVPRPRVLGVERRGRRRVIGMRVVVAHDLRALAARTSRLEAPEVVGRDEIAMRIVGPAIHGGRQARTTSLPVAVHPADQRAAALRGIGRLAMAADLVREGPRQSERHAPSQRCGSLR